MREITLTGDLRLYAADKDEQYITPDADRVVVLPPENNVPWSKTIVHAGYAHVLTVQRRDGTPVAELVSGSRPTYAWNGSVFTATAGTIPGSPADHATDPAAHGLATWVPNLQFTSITYDATYADVIASAIVQWPDGGTGVFTATSINTTWHKVDAFTVTHIGIGKTVTQAAVTRNALGLVTAKPALTIS